ncbi:hypothetical protein KHP62_22650, partial [Rhodobacteraceae bacterium NNCM2]|nr:hypothetical protein [Coraliihabitans acroporae]
GAEMTTTEARNIDEAKVWCSDLYLLPQAPYRTMYIDWQVKEDSLEMLINPLKKYLPVDPDCVPSTIFKELPIDRSKFADLYVISDGLRIISPRFRDLLLRFDMGASRFHELTLLEPDRETPSDCNPFYLFNLAETKPDTVLIELSETT